MKIDYDPPKRERTLRERELDMAHADRVLQGLTVTVESSIEGDDELRYLTTGTLKDKVIVVVWTPRNDVYRIISMRSASRDERAAYQQRLETQSGR